MIEYLPPELYELVITDEPGAGGSKERKVEFVERTMEDILIMDDGQADEKAFNAVISTLDAYRDYRNDMMESIFKYISSHLGWGYGGNGGGLSA